MFKPKRDYILVKPIRRKQSATLQVVTREAFERGMVVAAGPGDYLRRKTVDKRITKTGVFIATEVKPGDFIGYVDLGHVNGYYTPYEEDGEHFVIAQEKDVTFVSDREFIDPDRTLSDADIVRLIAMHASPVPASHIGGTG